MPAPLRARGFDLYRSARRLAVLASTLAGLLLLPGSARAQLPVHFFDFENDGTRTILETTPTLWVNAGGSATTRAGNTIAITGVAGAGTFAPGTAASSDNWQNAASDPGAGATDYYQVTFSTQGLRTLLVTWFAAASADGPGQTGLLYSTDGVNFTSAGAPTATGNSGSFTTFPFYDLGAITALDDQPAVTLRIYGYAGGNGAFASTGTMAIDNLEVDAQGVVANAGSKTSIDELQFLTDYTSGTTGFLFGRTGVFTIAGPNTTWNLASQVILTGTYSVLNGATLVFGYRAGAANSVRAATGQGNFVLDAASTLRISGTLGIVANQTSGNIRTATKTLSGGATYWYEPNIAGALSTGSALPTTLTGTVIFNPGPSSAGTITVTNAATTFHNVTLNAGAVDFGTTSQVDGNLFRSGGTVAAAHPPTYLAGSQLSYGASVPVGDEWLGGTSGPGVPVNVVVGPVAVDFNPAWSATPHTATGLLNVDPAGTLTLGSSSAFALNVAGNMTLNGTIASAGGVLVANGSGFQSIGGPAGGVTLAKLSVQKPSGDLALAVPLTVNGDLALVSGNIDPNGNELTLGIGCTTSTANGRVYGGISRMVPNGGSGPLLYPIGDALHDARVTYDSFVPVGTGKERWTTTAGDQPFLSSSRIDPAHSVNRYWSATGPSVGGSVTISYDGAEVDPASDPLHFSLHRRFAGTWIPQITGSRTSNSVSATEVMGSGGDYAIGAATWTITATAGTGGTIAPSGAVPVADGGNQTFTITPSPAYSIDHVDVDGVSQGALVNYTFVGVSTDHAINAVFRAPRTLTWMSTGSSAWETAGNWYDEAAAGVSATPPGINDLVVVDGSRGATTTTCTVAVGAQACRSLTVGAGYLVLMTGASASLTVGDGATGTRDLWVKNGGSLRTDLTTSGTPFTLTTPANDTFRIDDGGYYLHNSPRSFATPFPISACDFQPASTVEFGQASGTAITMSGRTYGNLVLSATGPKACTGTVGGANILNIQGELNLTSSFLSLTVAFTSSASCHIHSIRNSGGTLSFGTSTRQLSITGDIINNGTITTSATEPITFDGVSDVSGGTAVLWTNGYQVSASHSLSLRQATSVSVGKVADVFGTLTLRDGGSVGATPTWESGSTLEYAPSGARAVGIEWGSAVQRLLVSSGSVALPAASRTVNGNVDLAGGTLAANASGGDLTVMGNWTQSGGAFNANGRKVTFFGLSPQQLSLASPSTFFDVTVDKPVSGVALATSPATDLTIAGTLSLLNGNVTTLSNKVDVLAGGAVTATNGVVSGNLRRAVPTGSPTVDFLVGTGQTQAPVAVAFGTVSGAGRLTVRTNQAEHAQIATSGIDATKSANRTWTITNEGVAFDQCAVTLGFYPGDLDGTADPSRFVVRKYDSGTWTRLATGVRGSSSTQATGVTSFSDFSVGEPVIHTIVASAGTGGTIAPSGSVSVADGDPQGFVISPSGGFAIANVLVDSSPVGAVASYNFPSVISDHTIAASFIPLGPPNLVDAVAPAGCVSTGCMTIPVTLTRSDPTGVRAYSVTIQLSPELQLCGSVNASITQGPYLSATGLTAFQVLNNGGGSYTVDGAILGNPCGATAPTGTLFSVAVRRASDGTGTLTFPSADLRDCDNASLATSTGAGASVPVDGTAPAPITTLAASQVKSGNDADGTTKIALAWPAVEAGATVEVYRAGFGHYPEYDDPPSPGGVPGAPSYPPSAPWTLTALTATGQADEPATRDVWYYAAFVKDACGNASAVSNVTGGTLDYHLGDVSNGVTAGVGNNLVNTADLSLLGSHYGLVGPAVTPFAYLDVGPTTDMSPDGRPTTDDVIDFEDLIMFAINYATVSAPGTIDEHAPASSRDAISLVADGADAVGGTITARLSFEGSGRVQGLSAKLSWNPRVVEPVGYDAGALIARAGGVALSPAPGAVDVALLGVGAGGIAGDGELASITFRVLAPGDPGIVLESVTARDAKNQTVNLDRSQTAISVVPETTALLPVAPNPARGQAALSFALARAGRVDLSIYAVDGRRVRALISEPRSAGYHAVTWDGRTDSGALTPAGVYFIALTTPQGRFRSTLFFHP